jgi:DNA-binding CsgD family transcriptional regulator
LTSAKYRWACCDNRKSTKEDVGAHRGGQADAADHGHGGGRRRRPPAGTRSSSPGRPAPTSYSWTSACRTWDGPTATRLITSDDDLAGVRLLVITTFDFDEYLFQAVRAGASGFVGRPAFPTATKALIARFLDQPERGSRSAPNPLTRLTDREREVLTLVGAGMSNEEIAQHLVISAHTAKTHVKRAMLKLGARDRAQLVVIAHETGLVRPGTGTLVCWNRTGLSGVVVACGCLT